MASPWEFGWTQLFTVAGLLMTGIVSFVGLRTFGKYRKEKIEERRIEAAIDALAIGYEAKYVFQGIRSRLTRRYDQGAQQPGMSAERAQRMAETESFKEVLRRIDSEKEYFDRVWKLQPKFMAVFGDESERIFERLHKARKTVEVTAEALIDEYRIELDPTDAEGRERRRKWRVDVFASPDVVAEGDRVGKLLEEFKTEIEKLCRPIVDREYKRKNP